MFSWILALCLALLVWIAAVLYLWLFRRRGDETRAGLAALAQLPWRDFSGLVRRALQEQRGWRAGIAPASGSTPPSDSLMQSTDGTAWMVSCKQGRAYRIGAAAVNELGAAARLAGAQGGLLITVHRVEREGWQAAEKQSIEILDARRLWPMLKPWLAADLESRVVRQARRRAQRYTGIAGLAALALGLMVGLGYLSTHLPPQATPSPPSPVQARARPAPVAAPATPVAVAARSQLPSAAAAAPPSLAPQDDIAEPDPATLDRYQASVSRELARTPGITRGIWITRLTLAVDRQADDAAVWPLICEQVQRYAALRTVRIQLNPRPGVDEPVRWRQCSTI